MKTRYNSRRSFLKKFGASALVAGVAPQAMAISKNHHLLLPAYQKKGAMSTAANDQIQLGVIGAGIIGFYNIDSALEVPGMKLTAVCDLYDGRLAQAKVKYGNDIFVTKDYRELLDRNDIDAVLIATPDHWHDRMSKDAMEKGLAVYCEKPMVQKVEEGKAVIETEQKTGKVFQVGSQWASNIILSKAKELYESGMIGEIILVDAKSDRHSSLGAWQYSIPLDASPDTIDWDRFLGDAPNIPFDATRFFRWRNYKDYGTGMAGDLYVHLLTVLHFVLSSEGPERVFSTGGLRYWNDGREVPDVLLTVMDYPKTDKHSPFNMQIRTNFVAGGGGEYNLKMVGSEGSMEIGWDRLVVKRTPFPEAPAYGGYDSLFTFPEDTREAFLDAYNEKYYRSYGQLKEPEELVFETPQGYDMRVDHWLKLAATMRGHDNIVEDATFGLKAAGPSLTANDSYYQNKPIQWDPKEMKAI